MKNITKIAVAVASIAILILSIVVASVAWFTSNPEVNANDVTLGAAKTLTVVFDPLQATGKKYEGQTGVDGDGPYVCEAGFFSASITPSATSKRGLVKVEFGGVQIGGTVNYGGSDEYTYRMTFSNILLSDLFQVEFNCYYEDNENGTHKLVTEGENANTFQMASEGRGDYSVLHYTIANDGYVMDGQNKAQFDVGKYYFTFTYTFLPEGGIGYKQDVAGEYVGIWQYTAYNAKYHYGLTRYDYVDGAYIPNEDGAYVCVITSYELFSSFSVGKKYSLADRVYNVDNENGIYIKKRNHNGAEIEEYKEYTRYSQVTGFPYSDYKYMELPYIFNIICSVEEEEARN